MQTDPRGLAARLYAAPMALLALTSLFWAGNAVASRLAVGEITPMLLVFLRWIMVIAVLWPLFGAELRAHWHLVRPRLRICILMAALGFTGFNALFYIAGHRTAAVNIGILQGSIPVFVLLLALVVHGTRITGMQVLGVALTLVGVGLVATRGDPAAMIEIGFNPGDLLMLIACGLYAFYAVALARRPAMPGRAFFTLMALIAAITSLPLAIAEAAIGGLVLPTPTGWMITLYVAIFPSCLAQLFFLRGVDLIGPGRAGVFVNLVPVFAALLAVLVLGETFAWYHAAALALVLGGIWLAQRRRLGAKA